MSLLPDEATFEELVQECFLAHRGAGLMLSSLDLELVGDWGVRGVPFEIVARGIRRSAERALFDARPGEPVLRSLRACRKDVEAEIKKFQSRHAGATALSEPGEALEHAPEPDARAKKARAALKKLARARPELGAAVERLCGELLARAPLPAELDERLEAGLLRALPFPERLLLVREARALCAAAPAASLRAQRLARRFHRGALLRRQLALPGFW